MKKKLLQQWIIIFFIFKLFGFFFVDSNYIYVSGTVLTKIFGTANFFSFPFALPVIYVGSITIQVLNIVLVHTFLYISIVGINKLPQYLLIIFCLSIFQFYLYVNFGYLKSKPGLFNLFFHIWDLGNSLIVNNGILPFLIFIYKNETTNSKI
jgi:hypothetical protein